MASDLQENRYSHTRRVFITSPVHLPRMTQTPRHFYANGTSSPWGWTLSARTTGHSLAYESNEYLSMFQSAMRSSHSTCCARSHGRQRETSRLILPNFTDFRRAIRALQSSSIVLCQSYRQ